MRQQTLGRRLRAIILATPLIGAPACLPYGSSSCASETLVVDAIPPEDGGLDAGCEATCITRLVSVDSCAFLALADGGPGVTCTGIPRCVTTGRRPVALLASGASTSSAGAGAHFAEAARLEAASVPAFRVLASELASHGAPTHLIRAAQRSATDEVRHARAAAALARRYGAQPIRPRFGPQPAERSLEAIATENAIEGCVRETYGALVALWQARHAGDPVVAATMSPIAEDETRHAELAREVAAWAEPHLSRAARVRVAEARARAFDELLTEAAGPVSASLVALAGLPPMESVKELLLQMVRAIPEV